MHVRTIVLIQHIFPASFVFTKASRHEDMGNLYQYLPTWDRASKEFEGTVSSPGIFRRQHLYSYMSFMRGAF